jgi:hypothetical protein
LAWGIHRQIGEGISLLYENRLMKVTQITRDFGNNLSFCEYAQKVYINALEFFVRNRIDLKLEIPVSYERRLVIIPI